MPVQTRIERARPIILGTAAHAAAPTDGAGGTQPDFLMSPINAVGNKTSGIAVGFKAPGAGAATGPFTVVLWVLSPVTWSWFPGADTTIDFRERFQTFEVQPCGLYFQFTAVGGAGNVYAHLAEL